MLLDALRLLDFDAGLEREAMEQIGDGIAPLFEIAVPRERIGLLFVSDNAGSATSLKFWADALRTGVGLASPELFPWCLANAPCGALARRFAITGPNSTLLGEADALHAALDTSADLFAQGSIDSAMIVATCFAADGQPGRAIALRLRPEDGAQDGAGLVALAQACAAPALRGAIDRLGRLVEVG
jgi:hypothetical protein